MANSSEIKGPFDVAFSAHVLEHVDSVQSALDTQMGLLRPGGWLVGISPNGSLSYRKMHFANFHRLWGLVHPQLLDDEFLLNKFSGMDLRMGSIAGLDGIEESLVKGNQNLNLHRRELFLQSENPFDLPIKVLLVHPGTQHAPRLAEELERQGLLHRFWTGWGIADRRKEKRGVAIPAEKLRTRFWLEAMALLMARVCKGSDAVWFRRNAIFQSIVPEREIRTADVVIGFDTASHILAQRARQAGKKFILEQSILDPEAKEEALRNMAARYPEWAGEAERRPAHILRAERWEQRLADRISVPSAYVGDSIRGLS